MGSFRLAAGNRHLHRYYTVIVTAAVYWGFDSGLALLLLTFQHRAGVTPYTSSYDLAESCVFDKQLPGPIHCGSLS